MKKIIVGLLTAVLFGSLLAGCGSQEAATEPETTQTQQEAEQPAEEPAAQPEQSEEVVTLKWVSVGQFSRT